MTLEVASVCSQPLRERLSDTGEYCVTFEMCKQSVQFIETAEVIAHTLVVNFNSRFRSGL